MKKIILLFSILSFFSCKKEEEQLPCNCGEVVSSDINSSVGFQYTLSVRNECSDNTKIFYVSEYEWMKVYEGDIYCVDNISNW